MELDFTRLNSLAFMDFTGKKEAPKKPSETLKGEGEYKTPIEAKKPLETLTEGLEGINKLQREADRKKQDIDRSLAICREYQQNMMLDASCTKVSVASSLTCLSSMEGWKEKSNWSSVL